ncbi:hypothetical protein ACLB2K_028001 [Fragaria x ananassa]
MAVLPALLVAAFLALSNLELRATSPGHSHAAFTADIAKTWCVSNPSLSYETLQDIQTYACNYVDCSAIYSGGPCFDPSDDLSHAAFAMNAYYQEQHDCFGGSGLIAITDPSHGNCYFVGREDMFSSTAALNTWCVAKPTVADSLLQLNIDFACSRVNCSVIEPGGECQLPDTIMKHVSVAMNLYYHSFGRTDLSCYFQSTGMVVIEDPSSGTCVYERVVPVMDAVPASIKIKKGKSRAFSATSIGLMVVWLITGCGLMAVAVYVMLWLRKTRSPVVGVPVHTLPEPLYSRPEPSAPPLPV